MPEGVNLYIAPIGLGHLSRTPFYGGIQTQVDGYTKADRHLRKLGPGLLMSMWGQRSEDAIRPSVGGFFQSSGHEGDFVSVRPPVRLGDRRVSPTGSSAWTGRRSTASRTPGWARSSTRTSKDENVFVGALRFPGEEPSACRQDGQFRGNLRPADPRGANSQGHGEFGNLRVNGQPVETLAATAVYPQRVPDYAEVTAKGRTLVVEVGRPVLNRTQRQVPLLRKK